MLVLLIHNCHSLNKKIFLEARHKCLRFTNQKSLRQLACSEEQKVEHTCMLTYSLVLKNKIFFTIVSYISPVKAFKTFLSVSNEDSWEFKSARRHIKQPLFKGPGERGHIVADTLLPMMFHSLRKLGNICCG